ncbi:phage tail sheath family protein [Mangrovibacterium sp.]|uniref:phage tail sheath family protein n=1 Tax=Mangrovibacterium sp. TaxID=1961364 RepID=UPI0035668C44
MASYKTPGVYVEEISKLPASVAPVATAIPAFIGYTEKREKDGAALPVNTPVRISSMLEFEEIFGGAFNESLTVTLSGADVTEANTSILVAAATSLSPYAMHYHLRMYFANGGGPCYIVSVGGYAALPLPGDSSTLVTVGELQAGLTAVENEDEVTLLVVPEAITLGPANRKTINDAMLTQCNKLQDRFAIIDASVLGGTVDADGTGFRADVGSDNLKYGASYYPSLKTTINLNFKASGVAITDSRTGGTFTGGKTLADVWAGGNPAVAATGTITIDDFTVLDDDVLTINGQALTEGAALDWQAGASNNDAAASIHAAILALADTAYAAEVAANVITITAVPGSAGNSIALAYADSGSGSGVTLSGATLTGGANALAADKALYNNIVKAIKKKFEIVLYPSSTMAGVYARVDHDRGVWKAPANVSLRLVKAPSVLVTSEQQMNLNVDATSGKSINVIRNFAGKGIVVWGARTLAGNDNEWRYVPVRRLFIFVEESVKKATEFVVFEPNDAKTWLRTKTMIENFLSALWRDGALAGAKPAEAFFVKVGLGETMTALDILEGRMNIEIGMAAVRPAEFIILKFSHKLQES